MNTPDNLRYTRSHEWATEPADAIVTVGITDFAQEQLGDVVFVDLPAVGRQVAAGDAAAVVETNGALLDAPEAINTDAYGDGWLFRLRVADPGAWSAMLDAAGYRAVAQED